MTKPVIGLSTYREQAAWGVWSQPADLLHVQYADSVRAAGGVPVLLPAGSADPEDAAAVVSRIDGLVVCGGADVDPSRYGAEPHARTAGWRPDRDAWELALLDAADAAGLPVLGICRGMQLMAVHAGGVLDQHTPDVVGHEVHSPVDDSFGTIEVTTEPGSRVAGLLGARLAVGCHHHQSVRTHPGLRRTATAADGTVEAIEADPAPGGPDRFKVAVQWHPEMRHELAVFAGLVAAAGAR